MEHPGDYAQYVLRGWALRAALLDTPEAYASFEQAVAQAERAQSFPAHSDAAKDAIARAYRALQDAAESLLGRQTLADLPVDGPALFALLYWKLYERLHPDTIADLVATRHLDPTARLLAPAGSLTEPIAAGSKRRFTTDAACREYVVGLLVKQIKSKPGRRDLLTQEAIAGVIPIEDQGKGDPLTMLQEWRRSYHLPVWAELVAEASKRAATAP